jgi:hypothetical protein
MSIVERNIIALVRDDDCRLTQGMGNAKLIVDVWMIADALVIPSKMSLMTGLVE